MLDTKDTEKVAQLLELEQWAITIAALIGIAWGAIKLWEKVIMPIIRRREKVQASINENSKRIDTLEGRVGSLEKLNEKDHAHLEQTITEGINRVCSRIEGMHESMRELGAKVTEIEKEVAVNKAHFNNRECSSDTGKKK